MLELNRKLFAGKTRLQPEPFCPFITNERGRMSLLREIAHNRSGQPQTSRPSIRDGKARF